MRIGLIIFFFYKNKQHAHIKSVARLVDSENWSKKKRKRKEKKKKQHAHTKSVARLVDSENWSKKKKILQKCLIKT